MSRRSEIPDIMGGMVILLGCHLAYVMLARLTMFLAASALGVNSSQAVLAALGISILAIGLTQALYAVPICLYFNRQRQQAIVKGVLLGAVLTLLLNGSCFVLLQL